MSGIASLAGADRSGWPVTRQAGSATDGAGADASAFSDLLDRNPTRSKDSGAPNQQQSSTTQDTTGSTDAGSATAAAFSMTPLAPSFARTVVKLPIGFGDPIPPPTADDGQSLVEGSEAVATASADPAPASSKAEADSSDIKPDHPSLQQKPVPVATDLATLVQAAAATSAPTPPASTSDAAPSSDAASQAASPASGSAAASITVMTTVGPTGGAAPSTQPNDNGSKAKTANTIGVVLPPSAMQTRYSPQTPLIGLAQQGAFKKAAAQTPQPTITPASSITATAPDDADPSGAGRNHGDQDTSSAVSSGGITATAPLAASTGPSAASPTPIDPAIAAQQNPVSASLPSAFAASSVAPAQAASVPSSTSAAQVSVAPQPSAGAQLPGTAAASRPGNVAASSTAPVQAAPVPSSSGAAQLDAAIQNLGGTSLPGKAAPASAPPRASTLPPLTITARASPSGTAPAKPSSGQASSPALQDTAADGGRDDSDAAAVPSATVTAPPSATTAMAPSAAAASTPAEQVVAALQKLVGAAPSAGAEAAGAPVRAANKSAASPSTDRTQPTMQSMTIRLSPDHLGPVAITMRMRGSAMEISIAVTNTAALTALDGDRHLLSAAVEASGGALSHLGISTAAAASATPVNSGGNATPNSSYAPDNFASGSSPGDGRSRQTQQRPTHPPSPSPSDDTPLQPQPSGLRSSDGSLYV